MTTRQKKSTDVLTRWLLKKEERGDGMTTRRKKEDFEIPKEIAAQAENLWNNHGLLLLRAPIAAEQILIIGTSGGSDDPVLLSREIGPNEENNIASAAEAAGLLPKNIPRNFTCEGKLLGTLSTGFYDGVGDHYSEITFTTKWHAAFLQCWLDAKRIPICIQLSTSMFRDQTIQNHVALAQFHVDRNKKYAAFKFMSIQAEVWRFVAECLDEGRQLPMGTHTLSSGTLVTFYGPMDLFSETNL